MPLGRYLEKITLFCEFIIVHIMLVVNENIQDLHKISY